MKKRRRLGKAIEESGKPQEAAKNPAVRAYGLTRGSQDGM